MEGGCVNTLLLINMKIRDSIRDYVLANYDQADMFAHYWGIPYFEIVKCLSNRNHLVINPFRIEKNPSLGFRMTNGKIYAKDFGCDIYSGDIFNLVGTITNENCSSPKGFIAICSYIIKTYNGRAAEIKDKPTIAPTGTTNIVIEKRSWNSLDLAFWLNGKIHPQYLDKRGVYPVARAWINDMSVPYYTYSDRDLGYAYFFGYKDNLSLFKLYFPDRNDRTERFRTNNKSSIEAGYQLHLADTLLITKSFKDKMLIETILINEDRINDFCIMTINSEATIINKFQINALKGLFPKILLNLDYDKQGIVSGYIYKMLYNIDTIYLTNNKVNFSSFTTNEINAIDNRIKSHDIYVSSSSFINYLASIDKSTSYEDKDFFDLAKRDFNLATQTIKKLLL